MILKFMKYSCFILLIFKKSLELLEYLSACCYVVVINFLNFKNLYLKSISKI